MPRSTSHASNGPATAPIAFWWKAERSASVGVATTSAPPTTSECPPRYFVVECTTTSAPRVSGCCRYGEAKVLSTTSSAPASCATSASAGDVGDVEQRVGRRLAPDHPGPGRIAARTASRSLRSDRRVLDAPRASTRRISRKVPP
jgi:hypothetical protein